MAGIAIIALLVTGAITGCGDTTTTSTGMDMTGETTAGASDPCSLVMAADAETILGGAVGQPMRADESGGKSCTYETTSEPVSTLKMTVIDPCSMADYSNMGSGEPVEGIGMHADWASPVFTVHTMENQCLVIQVSGGGMDDQAALMHAKTVANMLIEKMGGGGMGTGTTTGMDGTGTGMDSGMQTSTNMGGM
jgi:hypothetical protein